MVVMESPARETFRAPSPTYTAADLAWEKAAEAAVCAYRAGSIDAALLHWRRGLAIARSKFEPNDPRLGTSFASYAFALRRRGDAFIAHRHFSDARDVFAEDWRWIVRMRPAGRAERGYDRSELASFASLVRELHSRMHALEVWDLVPTGRLERWREERPAGGSDLRKLMAASFLLVSLPEPS